MRVEIEDWNKIIKDREENGPKDAFYNNAYILEQIAYWKVWKRHTLGILEKRKNKFNWEKEHEKAVRHLARYNEILEDLE